MHILYRRLIALTFIIVFCAVAPILILFTAGYRYNFKKNELQKTGSLVLKSAPFWANIEINGKKISQRTPLRLNNVIPDEYDLRVTKDGYYPWQKKLTVKSQETTFAEDIVLFAKTETKELIPENIKWASFSPAKKSVIYVLNEFNQDYLYLLELGSGRTSLLYNNGRKFDAPASFRLRDGSLNSTRVVWANDGSRFLFIENGQYSIISATLPKYTINLTKDINEKNITNIDWSISDSNLLYGQSGNKVLSYNIPTQSWEPIYNSTQKGNLIDFLVFDESVYTIEEFGKISLMAKYPLNATKSVVYKTLELSTPYFRFEDPFENKIGLRETQSDSYYLVNNELDKIQYSHNYINSTDWLAEKRLLLTTSTQDLSYLKFANDLAETNLTRYSSGLSKGIWHSSANYAYALQDGKIRIIELDDRGGHFILELPMDDITDFGVDAKDKYLYFIKDNKIYQLEIK